MPQPGDRIKIITEKKTEEGVLMPSAGNNIIIKLSSGYNVGFPNKEVKKVLVVEKGEKAAKPLVKISPDKNLPTIVILHTGGTIASKVDYDTGAVTARFTAEALLELFPELGKVANIETELISSMMSEDMMFSSYRKIAEAVKKWAGRGTKEGAEERAEKGAKEGAEKIVKGGKEEGTEKKAEMEAEKGTEKRIKGIIIGHGTDTLGYTAAALSFIFEKINLPVLLVGSQRSSDRGSTDAAQNLISAARFIAGTDFAGVAVCMHHSSSDDQCAILPATKTRKMHTSRRDAFKAVNDSPIALVAYDSGHINFLKKDYPRKSKDSETKDNQIIIKAQFEEKVGLLKVHPNMHPGLFEFFTQHYRAFVIEGTGLGHAPTNLGEENLKNYEHLKKFIKSGGIVAITSQCLFGRVHPNVYTNLRRLSEIGCIFCEDMLPETAFIKLSWLLGNYSREEAIKLMNENLRGEINRQLKYEEDFLKQ